MNDRTGLIERAAARLRDGITPMPVSSAPVSPEVPIIAPARTTSLLSRKMVIDRAHLAQAGIAMPWTSSARIVEEFRIIKRNIMASWQSQETLPGSGRPPRVVMVTSARPREGKTFGSINLALAFAAEDSLVTVLVDADTVRGDASIMLQVEAEPGLTGVLSGELGLAEALVQTDLPNLVILPPGTRGPHVPELLSGSATSGLFAEIADRYPNHVIVVDTPPCLASTDPAALASVATQVVFVIEAARTQRPEIESALSLISACSEISFILNSVPPGASDHFGSYSGYYQNEKS